MTGNHLNACSTRRRVGAIWLLAGLCLAGCGDDSKPLYSHDFSAGAGGWMTARTLLTQDRLPVDGVHDCWISWQQLMACTIDAPLKNGRMSLESPWWLDPNHAPPGAGYLALLAWVYVDGEPGSSTAGLRSLDLGGAVLRISMAARDLRRQGADLSFWFQTNMPDGRFANYVYTRQPLQELLTADGSLRSVELYLRDDEDSWTCLGSANDRDDTYACMPVREALRNVTQDFGLIFFPVSDSPLPEDQPSGTIEIQSFEFLAS